MYENKAYNKAVIEIKDKVILNIILKLMKMYTNLN